MHFADFVDLAGEFENALRGGRFARINVGENADVAVFAEVLHASNMLRGVLLILSDGVATGRIASRPGEFGNPEDQFPDTFAEKWRSGAWDSS